jgi:hypothetical protein
MEFDASGQITNAVWIKAAADDPIQIMACEVT